MSTDEKPRLLRAGESCLVAEFGDRIDPAINARVQSLRRRLEEIHPEGLRECVPTYRSLAIYHNPLVLSPEALAERVETLLPECPGSAPEGGEGIEIPVCYGGDFGPDLAGLAEQVGLAPEEVVRRHTGPDYWCHMLGFTPGFAYLGGMDESIAAPRLSDPRTLIPAGSVGIAGKQTGLYPIDSPGGWRLIGRTPLKLFDPTAEDPILLDAGLWIRFVPVDEGTYGSIREAVEARAYRPVRFERGRENEEGSLFR
jgi:KipI family sensor histidine kinase inhibitor